MNTALLHLRYAQFLVIFLLSAFLYTISQSQPSNIAQLENNLWNRRFLITSFTRLRLNLGDRVFPQVLVGNEGWLEFTQSANLDSYQNASLISPEKTENIQQNLQKLYKQLQKRNITLLLIIPPNKATIYPDKLPGEIQKLNPQSNLDTFSAYIAEHGPPVFVDLRPALQNGRQQQDVYYETDTHWNGYGLFIAYTEIMNELSKTYPSLAPKTIEDFRVTTTKIYPHDLARILGATDIVEPGMKFTPKKDNDIHWKKLNNDMVVPMQVSETSNENLPRLLIYADSFGVTLQDYIAPHFSKTTFVYNHSRYHNLISLQTIDTIKPDIVIIEMIERSFDVEYLKDFLKQILSNQP